MKIPMNLKHKPVFVVENYEDIDGYEAGKSNAKGLSIGLAQWNDRGNVDISAKIWRYTGEKWSRQSEEMPLHRVIDLAILICSCKKYIAEAYRYEKLYDPEKPGVERIGLQGNAMDIEVCTDNPMIDEDIQLLRQAMSDKDEMLSERLHTLARTLREAGY